MARKALLAGIVLLALAPAARLAWVFRDMPHLGHLHDDSIYWVSAKSLAEGQGYRILSLPSQPYQTKYPPLYAVALAGIWKLNPRFPGNLPLATLFAWLWLPVFVFLAARLFRDFGLRDADRAVLCALVAASPWVVFLSISLMSELMFSCLLLAALMLGERAGRAEAGDGVAAAAGGLAAAAYLTKAAALPLLLTGPLWLALRRKRRSAVLFFGGMLPAVLGWNWWARMHLTPSTDVVSLYYTNYLGFQLYNVGWRDLPLVVWKNLDGVFSGIAGLMIFDLGKTGWGMYLSRFLAIGSLAGAIRLARQRGVSLGHWFAAAYMAVLLVWHYPPNERFLLPVFPLFASGLATELRHCAGMLKSARASADGGARAVAALAPLGLGALAAMGVLLNGQALFRSLPGILDQHRVLLASHRPAFEWIARHAPSGAFFAYDDPVFFLYTSRHASSLPVVPLPFYREDRESILRPFRSLAAFAREQRLGYAFLTAADFHRDLPERERAEVKQILCRDPALHLLYQSDLTSIYRIEPRDEYLRVPESRR